MPFEYAMGDQECRPVRSTPHQMMTTDFHPDGEWGETLGFSNGYRDTGDQIAELIETAGGLTDVAEREAAVLRAA